MPISLEQARAAKESAKVLLTALPAGMSVPERIGDVPVKVEVVGRIARRG